MLMQDAKNTARMEKAKHPYKTTEILKPASSFSKASYLKVYTFLQILDLFSTAVFDAL